MNRIFPRSLERETEHCLATTSKAVRLTWLEQQDRRVGVSFCHLFQRRDVIEDVESAAVGRDDEVMEVLLYHSPRHGSMWQAGIERSPVSTVVEGIEKSISRACEEQPCTIRIFGDGPHVREFMLRQVTGDLFPRLAQVSRLVDKRISIVHKMEIDADVDSTGVKSGWRNARDRAPWRQPTDIFRDVDPIAAIVRVPN